MIEINWTYKHFDSLDTHELYAILQVRSTVFIVEQNCPYLDTDDKDQKCWHLFGSSDNNIIAYARIMPPGLSYTEASIGRVLTNPKSRGSGAGKILMQRAISKAHQQFQVKEIKIGAQLYLEQFYTDLGFKRVSDVYLEDNIPHILMLLTK